MKRTLGVFAVLAVVVLILAASTPALAQMTRATGSVTNDDGKPLVGATIQFVGKDNGMTFKATTDKKGEFSLLGIRPAIYNISIIAGGQQVWNDQKHVEMDDSKNIFTFDLAKLHAAEAKKRQAEMTPEQKKQLEEMQKKNKQVDDYNKKVGSVNANLKQADDALVAKNYDEAIAAMKPALETLPEEPLLWSKMGDIYLAAKQFDPAVEAFQKAIALVEAKPAAEQKPGDLASYYNNMGSALASLRKTQEAQAAFQKAAQIDPPQAFRYYFNMGAIMTNVGAFINNDEAKKKEVLSAANSAFDKAIALKPDYAEAWYQKGLNLYGMATTDKNGKTVAPDGTAEAFQKYLELEPNGRNAEPAKAILASLGASVQTQYGNRPKKK